MTHTNEKLNFELLKLKIFYIGFTLNQFKVELILIYSSSPSFWRFLLGTVPLIQVREILILEFVIAGYRNIQWALNTIWIYSNVQLFRQMFFDVFWKFLVSWGDLFQYTSFYIFQVLRNLQTDETFFTRTIILRVRVQDRIKHIKFRKLSPGQR